MTAGASNQVAVSSAGSSLFVITFRRGLTTETLWAEGVDAAGRGFSALGHKAAKGRARPRLRGVATEISNTYDGYQMTDGSRRFLSREE